jgi:hypothetical protein
MFASEEESRVALYTRRVLIQRNCSSVLPPFLRFVRAGGVQDALVAVPGAVVTTAAHGALFAVAYHRGMPSGGRQRVQFMSAHRSCLTPGHTLS